MHNLYWIALSLTLSSTLLIKAQNANNLWYFGNDDAGIDFNLGPIATTLPAISTFTSTESSASICDDSGALLFYTNGQDIWDKTHNIMSNGDGLLGTHTSTQGSLILPLPGSSTIFYIFILDQQAGFLSSNGGGMSYSIIDMSLNAGNGAVTIKNIPLITPTTEKMSATRHANGESIWISTFGWDDGNIYSYSLTCQGVDENDLVINNLGSVHIGGPQNQAALGQIKFNHAGTKLAMACEFLSLVEIFDFDNATGQVSNPISINSITDPYGLEFSPDDSRLYITSKGNLYQFDLSSNNATSITNSILNVGTMSPASPISAMQIAPDNKIYIARYQQSYLSVINNPDDLGNNCNFSNNGISLNSKKSHFGLPNFIKGEPYVITETPLADFSYDIACINELTSFSNLSSGNIINWAWDFGDGSTSSDSLPAHVFTYGSFNTTLSVSNECTTTTVSKTIIPESCESLFIPSAFSPNNDGVNDEFKIRGSGIKEIAISIFNRWGEILFQSTDPDFSWDGDISNADMNVQVVIIHSLITFDDESTTTITKNLTIVR